MNPLPVISRELRVRARSRATYWSRFAVALAVGLVWLPQLMWSRWLGAPGAMGQSLLNAIVITGLLVSCATCLLTSDVISSERRDGTLGLLVLTPVTAFDLLLGKLSSAGLSSLCALVAFLPMLMIPVLAGGVTGGEAFRKALVLPDALFLALAAGLWASAGGHEWLKTARNALIMVATLVLAPGLLQLLWGASINVQIRLLSPLGTLYAAEDGPYKVAATGYWVSFLLVQAAGWALLLGARIRLQRTWREERDEMTVPLPAPADKAATEPDGPWLSCSWTPPVPATADEGETKVAPAPSRPLADDANPIAWLLQRQRGMQAILWAGAVFGLGSRLGPATWFRFGRPRSYWTLIMPLDLAESAIEGALFAWAVSRFFVEAQRTGELELLLTTPFGASQLVSTQWQVLKRRLRWPLLVMLAPALLGMMSAMAMNAAWLGPSPSLFRLHYLVSETLNCASIFFGVGAVCWVGLWFGLRAGGQAQAILWTVVLARALPSLLGILMWALVSALGRVSIGLSAPVLALIWQSLPQLMSLLFYAGLICLARRRLLGGLVAGEPGRFDLRQTISAAARDARAAIEGARHWTPS
jgi:hypothetical protein